MRLFLVLLGCLWMPIAIVHGQNAGECPDVHASRVNQISPDEKWHIFNKLSVDEIESVLDFLVEELGYFHPFRDFFSPTPTVDGPNIVNRVDLLPPVKSEALQYLDSDGPEPRRFARAIIIRSTSTPKDVMEYKIGPLPLNIGAKKPEAEIGRDGDDSPIEGVVMTKLRKDGEILFNKRPADPTASSWISGIINDAAFELRQIFKDSTGYCYGSDPNKPGVRGFDECGIGLIDFLSYPALTADTSRRAMQIYWFFKTLRGGADEMNLHSVPISFKVDESDPVEANWRAYDFEYCHQGPFETAEELLGAYNESKLVRCIADDWKDPNYDESWARTNGRDRSVDTNIPCSMINPSLPHLASGQAVKKQHQGHSIQKGHDLLRDMRAHASHCSKSLLSLPIGVLDLESGRGFLFEYLGWQGHVSIRDLTGIVIHDIRFRGERIVYELALQEQFVSYSGYGGNGQTVFMDSFIGLGLSSMPLRRGVDCPETAQFLPVEQLLFTGVPYTEPSAVCIFEEDAQTSEWRHTHYNGTNGEHLDGVRRSALVIRTVATVGNYDYIYSIRFKPDASVSVETVQAGYMLSSFHDVNGRQTEKDAPFGTRVHKHAFALLHDHLSGWKVDMDILGTQNSVLRKSVKVGTWEDALAANNQADTAAPPWHYGSIVKYLEQERIPTEFGFLIRDPGTVTHSFINEQFKNSWGEPRGYAIAHGMSARQLLPDSHPLTKAAAWSKYHLAVTQRKEEEPTSHSSNYDMVAPGKPATSLDDFIDGESIADEDLVAWVMIGVIHIPRSEDVPLISNIGTHFVIRPYNYFDELVSMDAGNAEAFDPCDPVVGNSYSYIWRQ